MYLNSRKNIATLDELSQTLGIKRNNLVKVSYQLSRMNLIQTTRGRLGGIKISESAGLVSLKEIVLQTENFVFAPCYVRGESSNCKFIKNCLLRHCLDEAFQAFLNALEKKSLNDITPRIQVPKRRIKIKLPMNNANHL